ncbi:MAG: ABC transporter ATP-binding protein [Cytophagaceae bacterium]|nr:ABC transporter ATP-binding protein [Cytophagaceae bacterium]
MLQARQVTRSYGELQVLKGIDLEIKSGEIVSIVGASGAGKSTLLHILGTLDRPDAGQVFLNGQEVTALNTNGLAQFRNRHIGFIFQFHNLLAEFTALENVCIPAWIGSNQKGRADEATIRQRATDLLGRLGLSDRLDHLPSELSGGEQQRTAVARALINQPSIIFADEPSGNLDSRNAQELHRLFFQLRDELGHTFVIVTHNEELARMADRQLEMSDGRML